MTPTATTNDAIQRQRRHWSPLSAPVLDHSTTTPEPHSASSSPHLPSFSSPHHLACLSSHLFIWPLQHCPRLPSTLQHSNIPTSLRSRSPHSFPAHLLRSLLHSSRSHVPPASESADPPSYCTSRKNSNPPISHPVPHPTSMTPDSPPAQSTLPWFVVAFTGQRDCGCVESKEDCGNAAPPQRLVGESEMEDGDAVQLIEVVCDAVS